MDLRQRRGLIGSKGQVIPEGYERLEYIQKQGTTAVIQIEPTYFQLALDDIIKIKMSCIYGDGYQCFAGRTGAWDVEIKNWNAEKTVGLFSTWNGVRKLSPSSNECIVGTIYNLVYRAVDDRVASGFNIGAYNNSGGNYPFYGRFYGVSFERDGQVMLNMIPAKRLSDGAIGMYETVQGTFFTSSTVPFEASEQEG